jgi:D-alanine-D-alanine ligase-like ATP-grasp enzyme
MRDLGLHYGRLDFLHDNERYVFLEVNPNGQWDG